MKIIVRADDDRYPNRLYIDIEDFSYGEDVKQYCKKLEDFLNDLMNDKRKKK